MNTIDKSLATVNDYFADFGKAINNPNNPKITKDNITGKLFPGIIRRKMDPHNDDINLGYEYIVNDTREGMVNKIDLDKPIDSDLSVVLISNIFRNLVRVPLFALFTLFTPNAPLIFTSIPSGLYFRSIPSSSGNILIEMPLVDISANITAAHGTGSISIPKSSMRGVIKYNYGLIQYISMTDPDGSAVLTIIFDEYGYAKYYHNNGVFDDSGNKRTCDIIFDGPNIKGIHIYNKIDIYNDSGVINIYLIKENIADSSYMLYGFGRGDEYLRTSISNLNILGFNDNELKNVTQNLEKLRENVIGTYEIRFFRDNRVWYILYYYGGDGRFGPTLDCDVTNDNKTVGLYFNGISMMPEFWTNYIKDTLNIIDGIIGDINITRIIMKYAYYGDNFIEYLEYFRSVLVLLYGTDINHYPDVIKELPNTFTIVQRLLK